jgi:hypothetical protein
MSMVTNNTLLRIVRVLLDPPQHYKILCNPEIYCKSVQHNIGIKFKYCKCKLCLTQNVKNYVNAETTLDYIDKRLTNDRPDL